MVDWICCTVDRSSGWILQLVEAPLHAVAEVADAEGEPGLRGDSRRSASSPACRRRCCPGRLQIDAVALRPSARPRRARRASRPRSSRAGPGCLDRTGRAQGGHEVLRDRVDGPEAVVGQVADGVLEVAESPSESPALASTAALKPATVALDQEVADGAEDLCRVLVGLVGDTVVGLGRGSAAVSPRPSARRQARRRVRRLDDDGTLGVRSEPGEEDARLLAEPGRHILLVVDRMAVGFDWSSISEMIFAPGSLVSMILLSAAFASAAAEPVGLTVASR